MGEEDKISLRLDPEHLGVFAHRFSKIWNMSQASEVLKLNESGHIWSGAALNAIVKQIQEVVASNPKSTRHEDQIKQKQLFWDLAELMPSFRKTGFTETLEGADKDYGRIETYESNISEFPKDT